MENEGMHLTAAYDARLLSVSDAERILKERYPDGRYEAVVDVREGIMRVYAPGKEEEI